MNGLSRQEFLKVALILGITILLVYGDVAFLGYSLSPALYNEGVLVGTQYGYTGRPLYTAPNTVLDPLATGGQIEPTFQLIVQRLYSGHFPLWNPYQGTGAPLAADPTLSTYFPANLLYIVPNAYWDYVALLKLWLAGIFCFLLLKRLGLSNTACMGGALAYALSGALVMNPFSTPTDIALMTPAVLFVAKKCIDDRSRQSIALAGIVFSITLLGAHIETLVIQFLFVGLFAIFEIITRKAGRMKSLFALLSSIALGFGTAAFFLFPVYEFLNNSTFAHGTGVGLQSLSTANLNPALYWVTLFVPYFYGFFQTYTNPGLRQVFYWGEVPGYVGTIVFFLSLLPLFSGSLRDSRLKYYWVFLFSEILVLMKDFGVAIINWIGYLPILNFVNWDYSRSILALSFAGACAFGLDRARKPIEWRALGAVLAVAIAIITAIWMSNIPAVSPSNYLSASLGYLTFSLGALVLSGFVASKGGDKAARILAIFLVLELTAYVPRSLPTEYEAARVTVLSVAGLTITAIGLWPRDNSGHTSSFLSLRLPHSKHLLTLIFIVAMVSQFAIASASPIGIASRYDAFTAAPYVKFLQTNTGDQRVFSPDGVFFAPISGIFSVQNLGEFVAFMPSSFEAFTRMNLDPGIVSTTFVGNGYYRYSDVGSVGSEIHNNLAFYSLLGVKYFITTSTDPGIVNETLLQPETEGTFGWTPIGNNSISTDFMTDKSFDGLVVRIGTYGRINQGDILLALDSISTNLTIHRDARLPAESILNDVWGNEFTFPKVELTSATEFRVTLSQSDTKPGNELAVMWYSQAKQDSDLSIVNRSLNLALGLIQRDETLPVVYRDQNATIYQNLRVFQRAFLVDRAITANSLDEALKRTRELGWETRDSLVIEGAPPELSALTSASNDSGSAWIERYTPEEVTLRVTASNPSFLVLTDTFYPGWNAYVDGKTVITYRAYGLVRAVFVTSGTHEVSFKYEPDSFRIGGYISVLSAVTVVTMLLPNVQFLRKARFQRSGPRR